MTIATPGMGATLPPALLPFADQHRWVVWRYGSARKSGKRPKIPYNPLTGQVYADQELVSTAGATYAQTVAALRASRRYAGIGFILGDGVAGVDFDACVDVDGRIAPRVAVDLAALNSYAELSPSGAGVKVLALGKLLSSWKADYCEGYAGHRFFTITGRQIGAYDAVRPAQDALTALWMQWGRKLSPDGAPRPLGVPKFSRSGLDVPPGFWAEVAYWERHQARLLRPDGRAYAESPQLRAYADTRALPSNLAAKGNSASEGRACVVQNLRRPGYAYGDAEAYVIARAYWRHLGLDTKTERELVVDALYLLLMRHPITDEQRHPASLARARDYARDLAAGRANAADIPPTLAVAPVAPTRRPAADAADYLLKLSEAAVCGVVSLPRAERAALAGLHPKTAQRLEEALSRGDDPAIKVRIGRAPTGRASYVQILKRIIKPIAEDVHTPSSQPIETPQKGIDECNAIGQHTVCPSAPLTVAPPTTCSPTSEQTPRTVSCPSPTMGLAELVIDAPDLRPGSVVRPAQVIDYLRRNGGEHIGQSALKGVTTPLPPARRNLPLQRGLPDPALVELSAMLELRDGLIEGGSPQVECPSQRSTAWRCRHAPLPPTALNNADRGG